MTLLERRETKFKGDPQLVRTALVSADTRYRYTLYRKWSDDPPVTFIMLNPSTADALEDDPTIRKCAGFAARWRCGAIYVGNLFAFRATKPADMRRVHDPVGVENQKHVLRLMAQSPMTVCAWGAHGNYQNQDKIFLSWVSGVLPINIKIFGLTKNGQPQHPLMLPYSTSLIDWMV